MNVRMPLENLQRMRRFSFFYTMPIAVADTMQISMCLFDEGVGVLLHSAKTK